MMRPTARRALAVLFAMLALSGTQPAFGQTRDESRTTSSSPAGPAMTAYVVRPGDTLTNIGRRYFTNPGNWRQVQTINGISEARRLPVGAVLRIPTAFFRTAAAEARVVGFRGRVTIIHDSATAAPRVDQTLTEGDIIETGPNAFLRLGLSDGGNISVPSNTRLRIDRLRSDPLTGALDQSFSVLQGRIESRVASVRNGGGYTVRTPVSVSAVRGTVFSTSFDADGSRATSGVLEGAVQVAAGGETGELTPRLVASGYGGVIDPAGLRVVALPARPYLVEPDRPQSGSGVSFDINPVPGAVAYRALLATDTGLVDVFAETVSAPGESRVVFADLPDGFHVVAVSAVSADGLEGPRSIYDFLRARNVLRDLAAAPSTGPTGARSYLFRWASDGDATPRYRFELQLADHGGSVDAPALFDREGLKEPQIEIPDLKPGVYTWRVRVSRTVQGQLVYSWSAPQTLTVRR